MLYRPPKLVGFLDRMCEGSEIEVATVRERFVIEIEDEGDPLALSPGLARTADQRLKVTLKRMLRQEGLRVRRICDGERVDIVTKPQGNATQ